MTIPGNILPDLWTQCHALQVVRAAEEHLRQHPDEIPTVVVDMPYSMIVLDTRECVLNAYIKYKDGDCKLFNEDDSLLGCRLC